MDSITSQHNLQMQSGSQPFDPTKSQNDAAFLQDTLRLKVNLADLKLIDRPSYRLRKSFNNLLKSQSVAKTCIAPIVPPHFKDLHALLLHSEPPCVTPTANANLIQSMIDFPMEHYPPRTTLTMIQNLTEDDYTYGTYLMNLEAFRDIRTVQSIITTPSEKIEHYKCIQQKWEDRFSHYLVLQNNYTNSGVISVPVLFDICNTKYFLSKFTPGSFTVEENCGDQGPLWSSSSMQMDQPEIEMILTRGCHNTGYQDETYDITACADFDDQIVVTFAPKEFFLQKYSDIIPATVTLISCESPTNTTL